MTHSKQINRYIEIAEKVSIQGDHDSYRVGAVLVHKGQIISLGHNSRKSHPMVTPKTLHAEIAALIGVRYRDLRGSTMVVVRTNSNGKVGMAKPCISCDSILSKYGVRRVYYTNNKAQVECLDLRK